MGLWSLNERMFREVSVCFAFFSLVAALNLDKLISGRLDLDIKNVSYKPWLGHGLWAW